MGGVTFYSKEYVVLSIRDRVEDPTFKVKDSKKSEAKDRLFEDRPFRGEGPRTRFF